jgi:type III pantothenate kinase
MILLLDVGNTRVKWAWLEYLEIARAAAVAHDATRRSWQRQIEADGHRPSRIVIASVAGPAFAAAVTLWARDHYRVEPEFISASAAFGGITNAYARPAALGVDRWLAMIAAWRAAPGATVIVSGGTALTVDSIDRNGRHRGGLIVPGLTMMREARAPFEDDGARLPGSAFAPVAGREALPDCALLALAALADRSAAEGARCLGAEPRLVLTGGDAPLIAPHLTHAADLVPDLVLRGLAIVATHDAGHG